MRVVVLALATLLLAPSLANADLRVDAGQRVGEVKAIGEDVRVDGATSGAVIVVDGDLVVGPRGHVNGAAVVGGRIVTQPGGRVSGRVFHISGRWPDIALWHIAALFALLLLVRTAVLWALVGAAAELAERPLADALSAAGRLSPLKTLGVGALAAFGVGAAALAAALTVVGLAVTAALLGVLLAATGVGVALALHAAGPTPSARRPLGLVLVLPVAGDALAALAAIVGMGAMLRLWADHAERRSPDAARRSLRSARL